MLAGCKRPAQIGKSIAPVVPAARQIPLSLGSSRLRCNRTLIPHLAPTRGLSLGALQASAPARGALALSIPPGNPVSRFHQPVEVFESGHRVDTQTYTNRRQRLLRALILLLSQPKEHHAACEHLDVLHARATEIGCLHDPAVCKKLAEAMSFYRRPVDAFETLNRAHNNGVRLGAHVYEAVATIFRDSRQWDNVIIVTTLAKKHLTRLTLSLLNLRVLAHSKTSQYRWLQGALALFAEERVEPTRHTFNLLIQASLINHDVQWTWRLFRAMETAKLPFDPSTYTAVCHGIRSMGGNKDIEAQCYATLRDFGMLSNRGVMNAFAQLRLGASDPRGAAKVLQTFPITPNPYFDEFYKTPYDKLLTSTSILPFFASSAAPVSAQSDSPSVSKQHSFGEDYHDVATYTMFIGHCAKTGNLAEALILYRNMLKRDLTPNEWTLTALIQTFFASKRSEDAIKLAILTCHGGRTPSAQSLALALHISLDGLPLYLHTLPPINATSLTFNTLIQGILPLHGGFHRMSKILQNMRTVNIEPDSHTMTIFLSYMERAHRLPPNDLSAIVTRSISESRAHISRRTSHRSSLTPSKSTNQLPIIAIRHIHIIFRSLLRQAHRNVGYGSAFVGDYRVGYNTDAHDHHRSILPERSNFTGNLRLPLGFPGANRGSIDSLIRSLNKRGVRTDRVGWDLRLQSDGLVGQSPSQALKSFQNLIKAKITPTAQHYKSLIQAYVAHDDLEAALSILRTALLSGVIVTIVTWTIIIVAYGRLKRPKEAHDVFREMMAKGYTPDAPAVDALARAYTAAGQTANAREVILQHLPYVQISGRSEFAENIKDLTLKGLFYLLRSQSPGGVGRISGYRRKITRGLVRRVVKTWATGDPPPKIKRPVRKGQKGPRRLTKNGGLSETGGS